MRKDPVPNLSPLWPTVLPKKEKTDLSFFWWFYVFGLFDLQNDLQIQIWPDLPNTIWGCLIFLFFLFFILPQNLILNIFSYLFCSFDHLSLWFFIFCQIFLSSAFIPMAQVFQQSLFLLLLLFLFLHANTVFLPSLLLMTITFRTDCKKYNIPLLDSWCRPEPAAWRRTSSSSLLSCLCHRRTRQRGKKWQPRTLRRCCSIPSQIERPAKRRCWTWCHRGKGDRGGRTLEEEGLTLLSCSSFS